jgi:hypothetical protein
MGRVKGFVTVFCDVKRMAMGGRENPTNINMRSSIDYSTSKIGK